MGRPQDPVNLLLCLVGVVVDFKPLTLKKIIIVIIIKFLIFLALLVELDPNLGSHY